MSAWAFCLLRWCCEAVCVGGVLGCLFLFVCVLGHGVVARAAFWCWINPGEGERDLDVQGKRLERDIPVLIPVSGVPPLCEGLVPVLFLSCTDLCSLFLSVGIGYKDLCSSRCA